MNPLVRLLPVVVLVCAATIAAERARVVESVLPSLDYGPACWSSVDVHNLGERTVTVDLEAHRAGGALVPLTGHAQVTLQLAPGERSSYRMEVAEESGSGWVKIREHIPEPQLSPVIAVTGISECVTANQLRTTAREVVYPTRDPWFAGDVDELHGSLISMVNTTEQAVTAALCYSSGNLYSKPGANQRTMEFAPICSSSMSVQIPPFGARLFPVERDGSSYFAMKTHGQAIVLQMLSPMESGLKMYKVDSTIKFGAEVPQK